MEVVVIADGFQSVGNQIHGLGGRYADAGAAVEWALAWPDYGLTVEKLPGSERPSKFVNLSVAHIDG